MHEISDIIKDQHNPNKGNKVGRSIIRKSLEQYGAGRSILVDKNGVAISGNNVRDQAEKLGMKIRVIETTGDELVVVKRTDLDINSKEGRGLSLADNAAAKANITWDKEILKDNFKEFELKAWGINGITKEIKSTPLRWMPTMQFKSSNEYDIPDLLPELAASTGIIDPFIPWGSQKRSSSAGSYHFYVDDYRFQTIFDKPYQVKDSGCAVIVEPNFSTDNYMPMAYGIFLIFKKRWFARLMQETGIKIFVDIHVADKFREINFTGVPQGWTSFATRGFGEDEEGLIKDIDSARAFANTDNINMVVYGGGAKIKKIAIENGCHYLHPFTQKHQA